MCVKNQGGVCRRDPIRALRAFGKNSSKAYPCTQAFPIQLRAIVCAVLNVLEFLNAGETPHSLSLSLLVKPLFSIAGN